MKSRIRLGILALPTAGALSTIASVVPGVFINPADDPEGFAKVSLWAGVGNMVGLVGAVFLLVGVWALYSFLAETSGDRWALFGLLLNFVGLGLFMPFIGILAFAAPIAGRLYLNGDKNALTIIADATSISTIVTNPSAFVFGGLAVLLLSVGSILLGYGIWQSQRLPKWSGLLYAVAAPLWIDPLSNYQPIIAFIGSLGLLTSGGWMAASIAGRKTTERAPILLEKG